MPQILEKVANKCQEKKKLAEENCMTWQTEVNNADKISDKISRSWWEAFLTIVQVIYKLQKISMSQREIHL